MGIFFRKKNKNSSDNNISISNNNNDVMYDIGIKLGRIESNTTRTNNRLTKIEYKLYDLDKRVKKLEGE